MPKVMSIDEIDPIAEALDQEMQNEGEEGTAPVHRFDPNVRQADLSDGGVVNGVRVRPMPQSGRIDFEKQEPGRPTARTLWMWNGRPSLVPLAWNPDGNVHDGGRHYLLKRHCIVCKFSGFYGRTCPACRKAGRQTPPNSVVPCFYLRKESTPEHLHAFGGVDCMVESCIRRGDYGFRTRTEMRQHAMKKHKDEYKAALDEIASSGNEEIDSLRKQVASMQALLLQQYTASTTPEPEEEPESESEPVVRASRPRAPKPQSAAQRWRASNALR